MRKKLFNQQEQKFSSQLEIQRAKEKELTKHHDDDGGGGGDVMMKILNYLMEVGMRAQNAI